MSDRRKLDFVNMQTLDFQQSLNQLLMQAPQIGFLICV